MDNLTYGLDPGWKLQRNAIKSCNYQKGNDEDSTFCRLLKGFLQTQPPVWRGEVPPMAEIQKAAEAASANDFIQKLEEKYDSMIGHLYFS